MTMYLVLYRSSTSARDSMANATPEQAQAGMDAWMAWAGRAGNSIVDLEFMPIPGTSPAPSAAG
jgi:hypothetical protein